MTRIALIKDGVVDNVIIAGPDYQPPDGVVAVASDTAGIGWSYAGGAFAAPALVFGKSQLRAYADRALARVSDGGLTIMLAPGRVALVDTDASGRAGIFALQAKAAEGAPLVWHQSTGALTLTPAELGQIAATVDALVEGALATWSQLVAAIDAGTVTTPAQIDDPAAPIPAWPANT